MSLSHDPGVLAAYGNLTTQVGYSVSGSWKGGSGVVTDKARDVQT